MSAFIKGTLVSDTGVMQTTSVGDGQSVPAGAVLVDGIAHAQTGERYVTTWPTSGVVAYHEGRAVRHDGVMVTAENVTPAVFLNGIGMTARGETLVATTGTPRYLAGFGITDAGALLVSNPGFSPLSLFTSGVAGAWYDPSDVLLNWRTNLLTYSQEFDNAAWTKFNSSVTANSTTDPNGGSTADSFVESTDATASFHSLTQNITGLTAGTYTFSAYVKAGSRTFFEISPTSGYGVNFNLTTGSVNFTYGTGIAGTITSVGSGWYRLTATVSISSASSTVTLLPGGAAGITSYIGNGSVSAYIWGAQLELGSTATTYQAITTPEQTYLLYDPQPVLFQDSAGTTPVTAVEQPVGLMLDKSQGLAASAELVPDYDFATPASWTPETADWVVSGGKATYTKPGAGVQYLQSNDNISIVSGTWYRLTFTISGIASGNAIFGLFNKTASANYLGGYQTISANGTYSIYFLATSSTTGIRIYGNAGGTATSWSFDSFGIKSIAGNHASQATAASRPVLRARYNLLTYSEQFDNAAWSKSQLNTTGTPAWINQAVAPDGTTTAEKLIPTAVSSQHYIAQQATLSATPCTFTVYAKSAEYGYCVLNFYGASATVSDKYAVFNLADGTATQTASGVTTSATSVGNGWFRFSITFTMLASGIVTQYVIASNASTYAGATFSGDGTSGIYVWGADLRTGSSAGTYQRIAAATDYATAGFLPYLALDGTDDSFGTGSINFSSTDKVSLFAGITKNSDAATGMVLELSDSVNIGSFRFAAPFGGAATNLYFESQGTLRSAATGSPYVAPLTAVMTGLGDIPNDGSTLRVNGAVAATNTADQGTGNYGNWPLFIGRRNNSTVPFNGRIYQLVVVGKAVSASELASTEAYVATKTGVTL